MASNPIVSFKPISLSKENILGMTIALEERFGITPRNDPGTTLNTKFGVFPNRLPTGKRVVKYFCWGNKGRTNDNTTQSSAQPVLGTNMALYGMRPFRAVPFENDLSASERAKYAMRRVETIRGTRYCLYYLKKIDFSQSQVQYIRTDPATGQSTTYEIDYADLSPTPPTADANGIIRDIADEISVNLPGSLTITGEEVWESTSVMDLGDARNAIVSEIGFVSASSEMVSATDVNNVAFTYEEAVFAQMVDQYNWVGQPMLSTSDVWQRTMRFSATNRITGG